MMSSTSKAVVATSAICCLCLMASVTSSPLEPVESIFPLELMSPWEACLFTCNYCFTSLDSSKELLECSNQLCGKILEGKCVIKDFIWLGSMCELPWADIDALWTGKKATPKGQEYQLH